MSNVSARRTNKLTAPPRMPLRRSARRSSHLAQGLDLLVGDAVSAAEIVPANSSTSALWRQPGVIEVTVAECFGRPLERCALQLQEPGVCAESIPQRLESET